MKRICILAVFCCIARPLFAEEEPAIRWNVELEMTTPALENAFGETIATGEYNWWTTPFAIGRFSGFGRYEHSDLNTEWTTRHTFSYAPMNDLPFLALAVEYGANQEHNFWQGGVQYIASRIPSVREHFQYLALAYFSDIRDAPSSSEWVARFETKEIKPIPTAAFVFEGIYRYRPGKGRARDIGSVELWYGASETWRREHDHSVLDVGISFEKDDRKWLPFWGARVKF